MEEVPYLLLFNYTRLIMLCDLPISTFSFVTECLVAGMQPGKSITIEVP